jgi:hypothetical protein
MKKENALFILGIIVIAVAVVLMVEGSILGNRTTGIAALLGILGILIIGFAARLRKGKSLF